MHRASGRRSSRGMPTLIIPLHLLEKITCVINSGSDAALLEVSQINSDRDPLCHCFSSVEQRNISLAMTTRLLLLVPRGTLYLLLPVFVILPLFAQSQTDVNHQDSLGETELMHVARAGDATRVNALIAAGADVNLTSKSGFTALLGAAVGGNVEVAQALIQAGANMNATETHTGRTPLIYAILWRRTQVAEALIQAGADVNIAIPTGETALISAALSGQSEVVQALIKAGANLNQTDKNGASALTLAAWNCHEDVVRELMKAGARPESTAWRKTTPPQFEDFRVSTLYTGPH